MVNSRLTHSLVLLLVALSFQLNFSNRLQHLVSNANSSLEACPCLWLVITHGTTPVGLHQLSNDVQRT